jgi:hypothetical protein
VTGADGPLRYAELPADPDAFAAAIEREGWGDGLPVVPPTPARVEAMLGGADAGESLGDMPPAGHPATLGLVAANAVMAGCRPALFPVVRAIVSAVLRPEFNLLGVQTTTHPAGPMAIVSGADHLAINGGPGALGPGWSGNATAGRAVRLVLMNVGGARPGVTDQATMGHPGKYTYVVGENVAESPWGAYTAPVADGRSSVAAGPRVTVMAAEAPHNVSDHSSATAAEVMASILGTIAQPGMNNWYHPQAPYLVLVCPEHAHLLAREGLSRSDVAEWVRREGALEIERFSPSIAAAMARRAGVEHPAPAGTRVPAFATAEQVIVVVAGGPGRHSMVVPSFGNSRAVQVGVELG